MIKKTIKYTDLNGVDKEEDFYFHMSKAEVIQMQLSKKEGFDVWIQNIVEAEDNQVIIENFQKIILSAVGERSSDGARFIKTDDYRTYFQSTEAYSELWIELATNEDVAAEWIAGLVPKGMTADELKVKAQERRAEMRPAPQDHLPKQVAEKELEVVTEEPDYSPPVARSFPAEMMEEPVRLTQDYAQPTITPIEQPEN